MPENFVSVSGISSLPQLNAIARISREEKLCFPIAIGYQISNKSINQGTANPRQPKFSELESLSLATRKHGFLQAFHYYAKDNSTIVRDLEKVAEVGNLKDGSALVQFNTLLPSVDVIKAVKDMGLGVVAFKAAVSDKKSPEGGYAIWKGDKVQDVSEGNASALADEFRMYAEYINYVMFDPSHGTNLKLDLKEDGLAIRFGAEIRKRREFDNIGLIYAGGINPGNVQNLSATLKGYFKDGFSIDVESGVRDIVKENGKLIKDELNLALVREYLVNCRKCFESPLSLVAITT